MVPDVSMDTRAPPAIQHSSKEPNTSENELYRKWVSSYVPSWSPDDELPPMGPVIGDVITVGISAHSIVNMRPMLEIHWEIQGKYCQVKLHKIPDTRTLESSGNILFRNLDVSILAYETSSVSEFDQVLIDGKFLKELGHEVVLLGLHIPGKTRVVQYEQLEREAKELQYPYFEIEFTWSETTLDELFDIFRQALDLALASRQKLVNPKYAGFLRPNESVELRAITTKKKNLLSTVKIETIFTSEKRTIFLNKFCTEKVDDDLEIAKGADVKIQKMTIEVTDRMGRRRKLNFTSSSDLVEFASAYKALASA